MCVCIFFFVVFFICMDFSANACSACAVVLEMSALYVLTGIVRD